MGVEAERTATVGLTSAEADVRRRRGEANVPVRGASRSYATIVRRGVFSFFNIILFVIGVALLALGRYSDALVGANSSVGSPIRPTVSTMRIIRCQVAGDRRSSGVAE